MHHIVFGLSCLPGKCHLCAWTLRKGRLGIESEQHRAKLIYINFHIPYSYNGPIKDKKIPSYFWKQTHFSFLQAQENHCLVLLYRTKLICQPFSLQIEGFYASPGKTHRLSCFMSSFQAISRGFDPLISLPKDRDLQGNSRSRGSSIFLTSCNSSHSPAAAAAELQNSKIPIILQLLKNTIFQQ